MPLSEKERQQIKNLVVRFEAATGIQAIAVVTRRADAYPETPWKAYAMGSALGAIATPFLPPTWIDMLYGSALALDALIVLGAGVVLALAAVLAPPLGRLFVDRARMEAEARQHASVLFLEHELFATSERRAVLVLLCRFERLAMIVSDRGLAQHAPPADLVLIGREAGVRLAERGVVASGELVFERLRALLERNGFATAPGAADALDDDVIAEKGA